MLCAYNIDLEKYFNVIEGLPKEPKQSSWICPNCKREVFHIKESINLRIEHFRHKNNDYCGSEPESPEHLIMKQYFYKFLPKFNEISEIKLEYKIGNQITDIFIKLRNNKKIAIECQHSKLSLKELLKRTESYSKKGIYVLWVLDGYGPCINYSKEPKKEYGIPVSLIEKKLHEIYRGRVYYLNIKLNENKITPLYALHFTTNSEVHFNEYDSPYEKYYKLKKNSSSTSINHLKLICKDTSFKIARFMDKNIQYICQSELLSFLRNYYRKRSEPKCINCIYYKKECNTPTEKGKCHIFRQNPIHLKFYDLYKKMDYWCNMIDKAVHYIYKENKIQIKYRFPRPESKISINATILS